LGALVFKVLNETISSSALPSQSEIGLRDAKSWKRKRYGAILAEADDLFTAWMLLL
jgi:hypothetical protein